MNDAWIGVVGAGVGALAGILGGWLTYYLTSRRARRNAVTEAAAELIAKASLPSVITNGLDAGAFDREQIAELILPWSEETMRARARLAALAPDVFSLCDFLWQRSSDQMMALLKGDTDAASKLASEVVMITVELEQSLAQETSGRHISRAID